MKKFMLLALTSFLSVSLFACGKKEAENIDAEEHVLTKEEFLMNYINEMTIEEKIGQMFILEYRQDSSGNNVLEISDEIINDFNALNPGGIILFAENIDTEEQTKKLISDFQNESEIPLFVSVDEEGGRVTRLSKSGKLNYENPLSQGKIGASGDEAEAYKTADYIAKALKNLGFNLNFAPVADVNSNPENTVIGDRAYGSDPELCAKMVKSAVEAYSDNNIASAVKHFPGHGDTYADSHYGEAVIYHDMERLNEIEFVPFKAAIDARVPFVMVGHIKCPNISDDNLPASLSKEIITDILIEDLGFEGIVITDALNMGAVSMEYTSCEAAVLAVKAGVDVLLMPKDRNEAFSAVLNAAETGEISEDRINTSVYKILSQKYDMGLIAK